MRKMYKSQISALRFQRLILLLAVLSIAGCGKKTEETKKVDTSKIISVYTVNYPLKYFAERIGADSINVTFPEVDGDPAFWAPMPEEVAKYQNAGLILLNGASYAKWVKKVSLPGSKMVNTSSGIADKFIALKTEKAHKHGPEGDHVHGEVAFTTWLDPTLAIEQAQVIQNTLGSKVSGSSLQVASRFSSLKTELQDLDKQIKEIVSSNQNIAVIFSHPVYQYMEARYGINGKSVHWEPEEPPTEEMWKDFKEVLTKHPAKWMIWEGDPNKETVAKLKELGIDSIVFDPCGNTPDEGDYMSVMNNNIKQLTKVYAK